MAHAHVVEDAYQPTLQERPVVLNALGVNPIAGHVLAVMVDLSVGQVAAYAGVERRLFQHPAGGAREGRPYRSYPGFLATRRRFTRRGARARWRLTTRS